MRVLVAGLLLMIPAALAAQAEPPGRPAFTVEGGVAVGLVVGDDSDFLDGGVGPWVSLRWRSERGGIGLAGTAEWLSLVDDSDELTGARAGNALFTILAGPTLNAEIGPVQAWLGAFAGVAGVRWVQETRARTSYGTGTSLGWRMAGGAAVPLGGTVSLAAEAGVTGAGTMPFGRAPSPDTGGVTGLVHRDVALLSVRLGIRVEL